MDATATKIKYELVLNKIADHLFNLEYSVANNDAINNAAPGNTGSK
jgi:hypothetical protein